jgi:uncharacterized repeat protein (TIGR03803 family)
MTHRQRALATGGTLFLAPLIFASGAAAQTLTTLYNFTGGNDGGDPRAALAIGTGGVLYGAACAGGTSNNGAVFSLTPPAPGGSWTETVLYSFPGGSEGGCPYSVVMGSGGVLYGTFNGGTTGGYYGAVFSLTPPASPEGTWTETVPYTFPGGSDGQTPVGSLAIGDGGVLYGTTRFGGISADGGYGVVFSLTPPSSPGGLWIETVLHTFDNDRSGAYPTMGVVIGKGGVLYGATQYGGTGDCGTCGIVFSLTPPKSSSDAWVQRIVYSFKGAPTDGSLPTSLAIGSGGVFYGTTESGGIGRCEGCGTVFSLTPPAAPGDAWTEAVLYTFSNNSNANSYPGVAIGRGGVLYGIAYEGGTGTNAACVFGSCGMVFSLTPTGSGASGSWTEAALHNFGGPPTDGANPDASVVIGGNGVLYGTTTTGGASNAGTVFALKP